MSDFESINFHAYLVSDTKRNERYRAAIFETVKSGDIVIDAGAGSGLLSFFALQAGASRVYAIETNQMIRVAEKLADENGLTDRIIFMQEDALKAQIPEMADVIVSELLSKAVIGQNMIQVLSTLRDRFLKPGGKIIPASADLYLAPIESEKTFEKTLLSKDGLFGLDFSHMESLLLNNPQNLRAHRDELLSEPVKAFSFDCSEMHSGNYIQSDNYFSINKTGTLHGYVAWFRSWLSENVELDNSPPGYKSWDHLFFPVQQPIELNHENSINLRLTGKEFGQTPIWNWETKVKSRNTTIHQFKQNSFNYRFIPRKSD